jgi:hypothetical protein
VIAFDVEGKGPDRSPPVRSQHVPDAWHGLSFRGRSGLLVRGAPDAVSIAHLSLRRRAGRDLSVS